MSRARTGIIGLIAVALIGSCAGLGWFLGRTEKGSSKISGMEADGWIRDYETHRTPEASATLAAKLTSAEGFQPAAMEYDRGSLSLLVEIQLPFWERIFHPGSRSYLNVNIKDTTGTFAPRWKRSLKSQFMVTTKVIARSPATSIRFGRVVITRRTAPGTSTNLLDYLDFVYKP